MTSPTGSRNRPSPLVFVGDFAARGRRFADDPYLGALLSAAERRRGQIVDRPPPAAPASLLTRGLDVDAAELAAADRYCREVLRPAHRRQPPLKAAVDTSAVWAHRRVSQAYAHATCIAAAACAHVVIYGYDLQLVPALLRRARPDLRIGLLLDELFPELPRWRSLPNGHELAWGVVGADLIGVPSRIAAENVIDVVTEMIDQDGEGLESFGAGDAYLAVFGPTVDTGRIRTLANRSEIRALAAELRARAGQPERHLIGIAEANAETLTIRWRELCALLRGRPEVSWTQVLIPDEDGVGARPDLRKLVEEINRELGRLVLRCFESRPSLAERVALYLSADEYVSTGPATGDPWSLEFLTAQGDSEDDDCHRLVRRFLGTLRWRERVVLNDDDRPRWPSDRNPSASGRPEAV